MKKTFLTIAVLLGAFGILFMSSCKDDDDPPAVPETSGTFEVIMDGNSVGGGTSNEVGMVSTTLTIAQGEDISLILSSVPVTVGETLDIDGYNRTVSIMGKNLLLSGGSEELYFAVDGTITRVSNTKFSFAGNCSAFGETTTHSFSGYAESDVYKNVQ
jgi:hypothetical protein